MSDRVIKLNDRVFKWLGIPLSAILVVHVSGFASASHAETGELLRNYLYFSLIAFCMWNGSAYAHFYLRNQINRLRALFIRIPVRFSITLVISGLVAIPLLLIWNHYLEHDIYDNNRLRSSLLIMTILSLQISSIYEIIYLNRERQSDLVKVERSEKLKVQAQLDALKSQIDPHFIFNSLNTLSYLIANDPANAKLFNNTLAKVYRYILLNKEKDLVLLKEEIEFASNYFYLLKIRYQTGLSMVIKMDSNSMEDYMLPPLSLQALIENAIKHNHFSEKDPLEIGITINGQEICVVNRKNLKKFDIPSSRIGLSNLSERYSLIVNRNITISQTPELFTVLLPILKS